MSEGIVNRKVEMQYVEKRRGLYECHTRKASPEELEKILNERGNAMGKRGPQPGFKRDKRININEIVDQAVIQASKAKDLTEAVRKNIEAEVEAAPVTEKPAPVTDPVKTIKEWDELVAQNKGPVLQEGEQAFNQLDEEEGKLYLEELRKPPVKSMEESIDETYKAKYGMTYKEFKAKQEANYGQCKGRVLATYSAGDEGEFIDQLKPSQIKIDDYLSEGNIKAFMHSRICQELNDLYVRKNHDYGDSFSETYRKLGIISAVTRITDKVNRIQSLCTKKQMVNDESLRDTLRDLANYAIMTIIEMEAQG